jgi:hypothetical protein
MHQKLFLVLSVLGLVACGSPSSIKDEPKNNDNEKQKARTDKCLQHYGLPSSLVKSEEHKFSEDCTYLELPESTLISHFKMKLEKAATTRECADVQNILVKVTDRKGRLVDLENKKKAEATDKYDSEIESLKAEIDRLVKTPVMKTNSASVFITPVKRHRLVDELKFMAAKGLSYSLDSGDMNSRKLLLKSYLVKGGDQEIVDESSNTISNLFYCSLASDLTKDQVYLEYRGNFNGRPFVDVFDSVLD